MTQFLERSTELAETPQTQEALGSSPSDFVRRLRILPSETGTRFGMDERSASEFNGARLVLSVFLAKNGRTLHDVASEDATAHAHSPVQFEIQPPLEEDEIRQFGRLCVEGAFVPEWQPRNLKSPLYGGVHVADFRRRLPDEINDPGLRNEWVATSLDYVGKDGTYVSPAPDGMASITELLPRELAQLKLSA
jgi:hypothetical protein